jgi:hypothetical protein
LDFFKRQKTRQRHFEDEKVLFGEVTQTQWDTWASGKACPIMLLLGKTFALRFAIAMVSWKMSGTHSHSSVVMVSPILARRTEPVHERRQKSKPNQRKRAGTKLNLKTHRAGLGVRLLIQTVFN